MTDRLCVHDECFSFQQWLHLRYQASENSKKLWFLFIFLIFQRAEVWNSYTIQELCKSNIPVLDVYDMALSTPIRPKDHVHFPDKAFYLKWINFRVDKISRIEDLKFSRGLNFANQPVFHLIYFIFLGVLAKITILKISRGQNFAKIAKIRENREN